MFKWKNGVQLALVAIVVEWTPDSTPKKLNGKPELGMMLGINIFWKKNRKKECNPLDLPSGKGSDVFFPPKK
eukprot:NODE_2588_length_768_cov_48.452017_g1812_i0.p3 GENE.NODE_2588_length_768_cov_48.452017_g1812_i0~~NODE_2588_length_768_cov_48.452017_g1812_i0.p3  ORF type:complete len:72 (-),score=4.47 NODE_2588_length_768_cov_48.452017_g1812_i0:128-343(-)